MGPSSLRFHWAPSSHRLHFGGPRTSGLSAALHSTPTAPSGFSIPQSSPRPSLIPASDQSSGPLAHLSHSSPGLRLGLPVLLSHWVSRIHRLHLGLYISRHHCCRLGSNDYLVSSIHHCHGWLTSSWPSPGLLWDLVDRPFFPGSFHHPLLHSSSHHLLHGLFCCLLCPGSSHLQSMDFQRLPDPSFSS